MKNFFAGLWLAVLATIGLSTADAQTVSQQPVYAKTRTVVDLGNGPAEVKVLQGQAAVFAALGTGTATTGGSTTTVVLTATPATPPCTGCLLSGPTGTGPFVVSSISGATITYAPASSAAQTSGTVSFGTACPASGTNAVNQAIVSQNGNGDYPFYTQARLCGTGHLDAGALLLTFPIGAH